jgi:hypothetical protein
MSQPSWSNTGAWLRDKAFLTKEANYRPTQRVESKLLKITAIFRYINSLLVKETHDRIFWKKTSNIPIDNGSSLNIPITVKIIASTSITLIETSILVVYLLLYYLIFNPPLLCTSSWRFEICLPSLLLRLLTANALAMPNRSTLYLVKRFYNKERGRNILVIAIY